MIPEHHPFQGNVHDLTDIQLEEKIRELNKKMILAYRIQNQELLTQVQTFLNIYNMEFRRRGDEKLKKDLGKDINGLINVD